jgi:hypothetical protein
MIADEIRQKLQDIIGGALLKEQEDHCTAIRNILCRRFETGPTTKSKFESRAILKEEQAGFLKQYAIELQIWMDALPTDWRYLAKGGEATVYLANDNKNVIKVNDGIYYATWLEYFNSILIHNLLFPETAYSLCGFTDVNNTFSIIIQQPFIIGGQAELEDIKNLLSYNGFDNIKRQDYYNKEFNLLMEDMHDENVIAKDGSLLFIDTVFYIMEAN